MILILLVYQQYTSEKVICSSLTYKRVNIWTDKNINIICIKIYYLDIIRSAMEWNLSHV